MSSAKKGIIAPLALSFLMIVGLIPQVYAAATITVINLDGAGEGFNDASAPDANSTAGGNSGTTLGAQRLQAFQFAADLWGAELDSSVEIRVGANFDPQTCSANSTILGSAGPVNVFRDFNGALVANTWYPAALANKLNGSDLSVNDDIGATFNSAIGTTCAFPNVWYYGLDGNPPGNDIDFATVVSHEIAHGLGFLTLVNLGTGAKFIGYDDAYMLNLEDHGTGMQYPDMDDAERVAASIATGNLHWTGPLVVSDSTFLTAGKASPSGHVQMNAPNPARPGSSVSHFDTALTPNEQQEPSYTMVDQTVGLSRSLMGDIGWFSVLDPEIEVISPNGGEEWTAGASETVTWTEANLPVTDNINVYLCDNEGPGCSQLAGSIPPGTETVSVTVPIISTNDAEIFVRSWTGTAYTVADESDAPFSVVFVDSDDDGVFDHIDNCRSIPNPAQVPSEIDPICGEACVTSSCSGVMCVNL